MKSRFYAFIVADGPRRNVVVGSSNAPDRWLDDYVSTTNRVPMTWTDPATGREEASTAPANSFIVFYEQFDDQAQAVACMEQWQKLSSEELYAFIQKKNPEWGKCDPYR